VGDWVAISSLATAGGTLALAGATFSATRSANRSAGVAEQALEEQRRPLLMHARLDDPAQTIVFADGHWIRVEGSGAAIEEEGGMIYLGLGLRNAGTGIAILQGWYLWPRLVHADIGPADEFRRQIRDIYVAAGDLGLWQGALDASDGEIATDSIFLRQDALPTRDRRLRTRLRIASTATPPRRASASPARGRSTPSRRPNRSGCDAALTQRPLARGRLWL
jgi:hypothetical protein